MEYDHFAYGEALASSLKDISHSPQKKRFFTAFGLEDLTDLNDSLSSVDGNILIAVDGCESDSEDNGADALNDKQVYSFIVAQSTVSEIRTLSIRLQNNVNVYASRFATNC